MVKKDTKSRREWKIGTAIIIVLFGVTIYFVGWFFYVGSPKEIVSVADQFKPGSDWRLTQEYVEPPRHFCIDVDCPSVSRTWEGNNDVSQEDLGALLKQADWNLALEKDCFIHSKDRPTSWCDASGTVDNYKVSLYVTNKKSTNDRSSLRLYLKR